MTRGWPYSRPWLLSFLVLLTPALNLLHYAAREVSPLTFESERELVRTYQARADQGAPLYYLDYRPVSAAFYTGRKARAISLAEAVSVEGTYWLAVHKTVGNRAPDRCHYAYRPGTGEFDLYFCDV